MARMSYVVFFSLTKNLQKSKDKSDIQVPQAEYKHWGDRAVCKKPFPPQYQRKKRSGFPYFMFSALYLLKNANIIL
jgi:hypothetical protein